MNEKRREQLARKKRISRSRKMKMATYGIVSFILGVVGWLAFFSLVYVSFHLKGEGGTYLGTIGFTSLFMGIVSIFFGVISFRDREKNYILSKIGIGAGSLLALCWIGIYLVGM